MLPGFRFLFAAIVLCMSILVFGLGAASLLRAAHEEVASNPSWRAAPETRFAQQEATSPPVLAMLRVEPRTSEERTAETRALAAPAEPVTAVSPPPEAATSVPPAQPEQAAVPADPETTAALSLPASSNLQASRSGLDDAETLKSETAKPEIAKPAAQATEAPAPPPTQSEPAAAPPVASTDKPAASAEPQLAATAQASAGDGATSAPSSAAAPAASEQAPPPAEPDSDPIGAKIATLGGPPVTIETAEPARPQDTKEQDARRARRLINNRLRAQRARQHQIASRRALRVRQAANPRQAVSPLAQQSNLSPARTP
jgi:hypothetical protein